MSFRKENGSYTVTSTRECHVSADSEKVASEIWFTTPALDKELVDKVVEIQLQTLSRDQGWVTFSDAGSWSWFDIVVLESPGSSQPKVKNDLALVWFSHDNTLGQEVTTKQVGQKFDRYHNIFQSLEVGNCIAVRVCAQFSGWENHAITGSLILKVSEKGRHAVPVPDETKTEYLGIVTGQISRLEKTFDTYLNAATPEGVPPAYSLVREMLPTGPLRADQSSLAEEPPLQLLSLDGGGVRGISSLYILKAILARLANDPNAKPCQYFHMIAGTSTGGLIAIMLGRLQMTVQECIDEYQKLAGQIFAGSTLQKASNFATTGAYYKKDNFEIALKSLLRKRTGNADAPMLDPDNNNQCKVFVVAGRSDNMNNIGAEHFRTYTTKFPDTFSGSAIWQAARATSAAPTFLPSITINGTDFVDGGMRFNNPAILLIGEVNAIYGIARRVGCFLTLGTGRQPNIKIDKQPTDILQVPDYLVSVAKAAAAIATDCETTNQSARSLFVGRDDVYWRFNAGVKVGNDWAPMIGLDDYQDMPKLVAITQSYLAGQIKQIEQCSSKLEPIKAIS